LMACRSTTFGVHFGPFYFFSEFAARCNIIRAGYRSAQHQSFFFGFGKIVFPKVYFFLIFFGKRPNVKNWTMPYATTQIVPFKRNHFLLVI